MRSLRQVLDQLADVSRAQGRARVQRRRRTTTAGVRDALAAAEELRQAARLVDRAYDRLAEGVRSRPAGSPGIPTPAVEEAAPSRWVNVVFLQGDEADRPLRILGRAGACRRGRLPRAVGLRRRDHAGGARERVRLRRARRGHQRPGGDLRRLRAVVNPHLGYVSLLRRYTEPDTERQEAERPGRRRRGTARSCWCRTRRRALRSGRPAGREAGWVVVRAREDHCGQAGAGAGAVTAGSGAAAHRRAGRAGEGTPEAPQAAPPRRSPARTPSSARPQLAAAKAKAEAERAERRATIYLPEGRRAGRRALRTPGRFRLPRASGHLRDAWRARIRSSPKAASAPTGCSSGKTSTPAASFVYDPWVLYARGIITAPNVVLAGIVGSGKSSSPSRLYTRSLPFGRRVYVPGDPKGEHTAVADAVGGRAIVLGHGLQHPAQPARRGPPTLRALG